MCQYLWVSHCLKVGVHVSVSLWVSHCLKVGVHVSVSLWVSEGMSLHARGPHSTSSQTKTPPTPPPAQS